MDFLQSVKRLRQETKRSGPAITTIAELTGDDLQLADLINDAWLELQRRDHGWEWMRRELVGLTVALQRGYTADQLDAEAGDFGRWFPPAREGYVVTAETGPLHRWRLKWMPWDVYRDRFELTEHQPGNPLVWTTGPDEKMYFGPTPDDEYTVRASYWIAPTSLLLDEDTPAMGSEYHMILVWRALMEVASIDAAPEVYSRGLMNYERLETDLMRRYGPQFTFGTNRL